MSFWVTTKRVARYGFIGFLRNGFVSLAAILIMTITLFVAAVLLISGAALNSVLKDLTSKVDITVYLSVDATPAQVQALQTSLQALPEVASVSYTSSDQALAAFEARHANDQLTMQALQELPNNPLEASLQVQAKDTSQYATIAHYLDAEQQSGTPAGSAIDTVNYTQNETAIAYLDNVIQTSKKLGIAIAIVLALASLLIAFNTIRLAIYTSRDEIGIMNLVGAGPWYVRGPFMIAGVLYGIVAAIIVLALLYPLTVWLGPSSQEFFGTFNVYDYFVMSFWYIFLIVMGSGIGLGILSSYLAVRRYLRI
ncbi:MAG TPA: permease-like cell division protein FtsX [Candidatus Paceibacterota bacterium]|nr:permease-like cell division protein FtsX [Candidatus Paceibacterota bacterium]